jgi:hypothetical protein
MWKVVVTLALAAHAAHAVCFCPRVCLPTYEDACKYRDRTLCADLEAASECNAANDEVTDAVNSLGRNADLFLTGAMFNGTLNPAAASELRTKLSIAIETDKPVADCEAGMATETRVKNTNSHCFSPELLTQCVKLRDGIDGWALQLRGKLANLTAGAKADPKVVAAFVSAMGDRSDATTANIRCAAYEEGIEDINGGLPMVPGIAVAFVMMFALL